MVREMEFQTSFGPVKATWTYTGPEKIEVRFGDRVQQANASSHDTGNELIARDIVRGWINDDLREEA